MDRLVLEKQHSEKDRAEKLKYNSIKSKRHQDDENTSLMSSLNQNVEVSTFTSKYEIINAFDRLKT